MTCGKPLYFSVFLLLHGSLAGKYNVNIFPILLIPEPTSTLSIMFYVTYFLGLRIGFDLNHVFPENYDLKNLPLTE